MSLFNFVCNGDVCCVFGLVGRFVINVLSLVKSLVLVGVGFFLVGLFFCCSFLFSFFIFVRSVWFVVFVLFIIFVVGWFGCCVMLVIGEFMVFFIVYVNFVIFLVL